MANNNIQARLADLRQRNAARTGRDGQEPAGSRPAGGSIQDRLAELRQRNAQRQVKEQSTPTADRARLGLATGGNPVSDSLTRFTRERESEAMARTGSEAEALKLQLDTLSAQKAALEERLTARRAAEQPQDAARRSALLRTAQGWSQRQELGQEPERGSDRVSARIEALERERSALLPQYYAAKNEATLRRMEGDAALKSLYAQAKALREDLDRAGLVETGTGTENGEAYRAAWDGLKEKYGVSRAAELPALHERLLREFDALEEQLAAQGVDYEYLRAYEQMAEDRAAWVEKQAETEAYAREHPVMASVESVLKSPMQGLDLLSLGTPGAGRNDPDSPDTYVPLNVYGMDVSNFVNTVRGTVSEEIEKNTDWELFGQNVASFLYQTGMSVADSAAQVALFGPGATYLMGASAAANQAREVIERGGTNRQALLSGLAAGAAEALFEKVSVERLLSERSVRSMRDLLAETLKQAGTEASEEMLTEVSNLLSDAAIMGSGSNFAARVERHRQEGLSEEAARRRAFLDCLSQVAWAGAGGALSGGVMGGTVRGANYLSGAWNQVQSARASRPTNEQLLSSLNQRLSQPGQVEADLRPYSVLNGTENSAVDALQEREARSRREQRAKTRNGANGPEAPEGAEDGLRSWSGLEPRREQAKRDTENAFREELRRQLTGSPAAEDAGQNNTIYTEPVQQPQGGGSRIREATEPPTAVQRTERARTGLERSGIQAGVREETIQTAQRLSDILGRNIRFYDGNTRQDASGGANGYYVRGEDTIYINSRSRNPVAQIISHELTHSVELAGAYEDLSGLVLNRIRQTGGNLEQLRQEKAELYAGRGAQLASQEEIDREIVAQYVERYLLTDEQSIRELTQQNRSLGQRILSWLNELLAKLGNTRAQERAFLTRARDAYARALQQTQQAAPAAGQNTRPATDLTVMEGGQTARGQERQEIQPARPAGETRRAAPEASQDAQEGRKRQHEADPEAQRRRSEAQDALEGLREDYAAGRITEEEFDAAMDAIMEQEGLAGEEMLEQYSIDENYERDIDDWDAQGRPDGEVFILGSTGDVLQGLGAMEQDIYLRSEKVNAILQQHPEMTLAEIKRIPEILDDPVLVLKSRNVGRGGQQNTRLVLFGTVRAENGQPVLAVLDLRPVESGLAIDDMQKVNSAYTRNNGANFVRNSDVMYADEKRTIPLLRTIGFQMPIELQRSGSMGSIADEQGAVNADRSQSDSSPNRLAHTGPERLLRSGYMGSIAYRNGTVNLQGVPFGQVVGTAQQQEDGQQYSIDGQDTDRADSLGEEIRRQIYGENTALDRGRETDYDGGRAAELTAEEEAALLDYKSGGSYQLNAALRDGYPLDQMQYRTVEALDAALEKLPPYQGTVYRRVGFDSIGGQEAMDAFLKEHDAGEIIRYPAYTSTSTDPEGYTLDGDLTVTLVMESAGGRNLEGYGNNFEREVLFPRNSRFGIERVEKDVQGKPVIFMREVTENGIARFGRRIHPQEQYGEMQGVQETQERDVHLRGVPEVDSGRGDGQRLPGFRAEGDAEGEGLNGSDIRYSVDEAESGPKTAEDIISTMPVKAQQYLRRAESYLTAKVGNLLSVPRYAQREYLRDIVRETSLEYLREGRVSGETIDGLFDRAYDGGVVADREFYDQYRDLRDYLRSTRLTISPEDSADIPDFNDFRKSNFGRLNISTQGGTNIDRVYQELESMWPEFFSEERQSNPSDQLQHIADVAKSFQVVEKNLDEYYGPKAAEFRRWARHDFEAAILDGLSELGRVRRYVQERETQATTAETVPTTQEEVAQMWGQLKQARRTYEKAAARNLLTQHDQVQVGRLLRGEIELEHLNEKTDNVKGIREVYQAKLEYERLTRMIRQWNQSRKDALRLQADRYLQTANDWKDKRAGILYSRETMERNIRDIINDEALAGEINQTYFAPVHDAAAAANRMKNQYRDRVRELNLSRNVAKGNTVSEAHAVQLLGEAEDNIRILEQSRGRLKERDGKSLEDWRGIVDGLWEENPNLDAEKIRAAVEQFRTIYDELFQQMNEVRVRNGYEPVNYRSGYFPHFQPGNGDGILAQFGKALGIDTEVTALPTTINGLTHTFRPGIRWFGNAQERLGFNTTYDAVEGFDRYIEGVADVIHQTDNIQRLRALASQARYRTGDNGIRRQVDEVRANPSLTEEDKQNRIEKIYEKGRFALSNFVVELEEYTNLLANKKSRADRNMEQALGRNMYNLVKALESRVAANMVAVNPASWVTNFIPLTQGGSLLDRGMLLKGMWDTLKAYKADDGIVDKSSFLTNRRGSDPLVRTWAQKASATASRPMEYIDQFVADSLVRARYRQNLGKGLSEDAAMSEADAWVAGVMADRSKGSTPTLFNRSNPITKVFTQFQLEVNNQLSYLFKDIPRDVKDRGLVVLVAALLKFFLGAWLFNEVYEFVIGRRPALDPIGILNDTVGDLTGWELPNLVELSVGAASGNLPSFEVEQTGLSEAGRNLAGDVLEQLPFIGGVLGGGRVPISSAVPDFGNLWDAATEDGWSTEKRLQEVRDELLEKPVAYLGLPFGGGQLKKIYEGIEAVIQGGSYSINAEGDQELQYPIYNDTPSQAIGNALLGSTFGRTSLPAGRDWIESGFDTLGAKQTAVYQGLLEAGVPGEEAYALLEQLRGAEKTETESEAAQERRLLEEADISGDGKSIAYYGLMASDRERELMDELADQDADMGEVTAALMAIKDAGALSGAAASNAKRDAIAGAALSEDEQIQLYNYTFGEKQDDGSYVSSRADDITAFQEAGLSFDQFLEAQNEYSTINEEYDSSSEKAVEFARWVNGQGLTEEQTAVVKDAFTYYSQIPQSGGYYEKFTAAGMNDESAYSLNQALDELEPLEGEDQVSSLQKYQAVVNSDLTESEQMTAMGELMPEAEYRKLRISGQYDISPAQYIRYREMLASADALNEDPEKRNKSIDQDEAAAAINGMLGLTGEQKAALWQLQNKSWKPNRNPFNTAAGQAVYNYLHDEGLPSLTGGGELPPLPSLGG